MSQPGSPSAAGVTEGDVIAGKYRVERILGIGGMGIVVAAHHLQLDEKVALKFLLPQSLADADTVARFLREARAAVKIKNEHVARVIDVGTLTDGAPYMVMEYLDGGDLAAWLKQQGPLPIEQAIEFVLQACVAVADAHALGIVHRDLKPANLFCVRRSDGQLSIKVLDFGISKLASVAGAGPSLAMTKTASMMGSPLYMSPEQMRSSKDVDAQTDIWALGVILFELLTGVPPFDGATLEELRVSVTTAPAPRVPNVAAPLQAAIHRCLAKDPDARFASVHALAEALAPFAPGDGALAAARVGRIVGTLETMSDTPIVRDLVRRPGRPRTTMAVAGLTVAGVLAGVVAWMAIPGSSTSAAPRASSTAAGSADTPRGGAAPPQASTAAGGAEVASSAPLSGAVAVPPVHVAGTKPSRAMGIVVGAVADAGAPAAAPTGAPLPAPDPLHLDAGFLFRERK